MPATEARRWPQALGPWLGVGAAPAALTLGAAMAQRHGGAVPLIALLAGAALMIALLASQGRLGLKPPHGDDGTLTDVAPAYLSRLSRMVLGVILALAMIGWNGFNVGLGGASLATVTGLPGPVAAVLLGALVFAVSFAPAQFANRTGIFTTLCAIALIAFCVSQLSPPTSPVDFKVDSLTATAADIAALGGYIAVFAVRAPDFSRGLARRRDLAWCVGLLVFPAVCAAVAGAGIWLRTGEADVVAVLASSPGIATYANLFITLAVFTPALTTTYSGALAMRSVLPRLPAAHGMLVVAIAGGVLAAARFDTLLLPWLAVLAAVLPPLIVPMAAEAALRRRGRPPHRVPLWTWLPAGAFATVLTSFGLLYAPIAGLLVASLATALSQWLNAAGRAAPVR
jgi:cytosine permease